MLYFVLAAVVVITVVFLAIRDRDVETRASILRGTGFGLMALSTLLFGTFVVADTVHDPGGWEAVGMIAAWAVPMAGLAALSWFWPDGAVWVICALVVAMVGVATWFAVDVDGWTAFEDRNGPVRDIALFVVAAGAAVLGLRRTASAGVLLLILGVVPTAIASVGSLEEIGPAIVFSTPVIAGILYLLSANLSARAVGAGLPQGRPRPA